MTTPPQTISEQATPTQWIERLEIFRERFRLGLLDENKFKEIVRHFQFTDNLGHIWMAGATSNQWYIWDRTQWSVAAPPAQLAASAIPLAVAIAWGHPVPPAPPLEKPPTPNAAAPIEIPPARVDTQPAPPARPSPRARPTDVPERGRTRGASKPTDLPR